MPSGQTNLFVENEILELKKSTSELKAGICSIVAIINKHFGVRFV